MISPIPQMCIPRKPLEVAEIRLVKSNTFSDTLPTYNIKPLKSMLRFKNYKITFINLKCSDRYALHVVLIY